VCADPGNWFWLGVGSLPTILMVVARWRFAWLPLQRPRFGGHEAYKEVARLAPGVILSESCAFVFRLLIDFWQGRIGHSFLP